MNIPATVAYNTETGMVEVAVMNAAGSSVIVASLPGLAPDDLPPTPPE